MLLDPAGVVDTMHDAYARLDLAASPYGVFLAGPSATGDIEGVIIHGAQGRGARLCCSWRQQHERISNDAKGNFIEVRCFEKDCISER